MKLGGKGGESGMEVGDGFNQDRLFTCMKFSNNKLKEILLSTLYRKIVFSSVFNFNIQTYKKTLQLSGQNLRIKN